MASNALDLAGTGYVNAGSPAALDNLLTNNTYTSATPITVFILREGGVGSGATEYALVTKDDSGNIRWNVYMSFGQVRARVGCSGSTLFYTRDLNAGDSAGTWYWDVCVLNPAGSAGSRINFFYKAFADSSLSTSTNEVNSEPLGTVSDDSGGNLIIGAQWDGANPYPQGMAFVGIVSGAKTAGQCDSIIADMAGTSWITAIRLGWSGNGTAPDFTSTASPTVSGTTSLITTAPDYWTGGATGLVTPWRNVTTATKAARYAALW